MKRVFYHIWSWKGLWTWGFGLDRHGLGFYLGPLSFWVVIDRRKW